MIDLMKFDETLRIAREIYADMDFVKTDLVPMLEQLAMERKLALTYLEALKDEVFDQDISGSHAIQMKMINKLLSIYKGGDVNNGKEKVGQDGQEREEG